MNIKQLTQIVFKGFYSVTEVSAWIGYIALVAIILIVVIDVCGRYFLNKPLNGAYELVQLAMIILGGVAIFYTAVKRGHVAIDLFTARFPRRTQIIMQSIASLLGFGTWALLAYQIYLYALEVLQLSTTTDILDIPLGPFLLTLAVATFLCCLTLLIQAFYPEVPEKKPEKKEEAA